MCNNVRIYSIYKTCQGMGMVKWRDSDRVAFSLVGCDSVTLAADGGLSFVCPMAAINTACNLDNMDL